MRRHRRIIKLLSVADEGAVSLGPSETSRRGYVLHVFPPQMRSSPKWNTFRWGLGSPAAWWRML